MAKYLVEHACGHFEEVQIYGRNVDGERERKAAWLAERPCPDCEREEQLAQAHDWEGEVGASAHMAGSPKQVEWARRIRFSKMCGDANLGAADEGTREVLMSYLLSRSAPWWIDRRDDTLYEIVRDCAPEIREHAGFW